MGDSRAYTSICVLILAAVMASGCQLLTEADEPDSANDPAANTGEGTPGGNAPPAVPPSVTSPTTSFPTTTAPEATQTDTLLPTSDVSDAASDEDAAAGDPPTSTLPLASTDTVDEVPAEDQFATDLGTVLAASYPDRTLAPQSLRAHGDLNGDGIDDYIVHAVEETSGSAPTSWLVPAVDAGGAFHLGSLIELGQGIIVETIGIRDGMVEVSLFDRSPYEPPTMITRRTTLSVEVDGREATDHAEPPDGTRAAVTATRVEPIHNVPSLQIARPPVTAAFGLDGFGTALSDRIKLRERHPFVVHASENDIVVATLDAPAGIWLEARLGDDAPLVPIAEQTQRFASRMPASGAWMITVASSLIETADYRLSIEVFPPELGERIATRDLDGFWSSTRTSPPAVPDDGPVIYLTFDDGPHPTYTPQVLDVLAKHGTQATFFVVGYLAERYPLIMQRIAHEGHTLANHSWDHRSLARVSRAAFDRSVGRTQELLGPLATPCIRPPYYAVGEYTQQWSAEHGLRLAAWSYSPQDWLRPSARTIANGIVARSRAGAVILLHDGGGNRSSTVRGLDMALERLADSGLEFKALCR